MATNKPKRSLRNRLLTTVIFVAVYPIILVVIVGILNYENVVKERFFDAASGEMALVSNYINEDVEDMDTYMIGILSDQGLYDLINRQSTIRTDLNRYEFDRDISAYLTSAMAAKLDFDVVGLHLFERNYYYWEARRTGTVLPADVPFEAIEARLLGDSGLRTALYDDEGIWLARKILDKDTLKEQGVLFFRIGSEHLKTLVGDRDESAITTNYLMTGTGEIVANSGGGGHGSFIKEYALYTYDKGNYERTFGDDDYLVSIDKTDLLDLTIIRLTTKEELLDDLQKVTDLIIILSLVNLPLYVAIGLMLYRSIMTPVEKLVKGMSSVEAGDMAVRLDTERKDEFGYMMDSFNSMTDNMTRLINEVYVKELARKDAEISALQEQINPHFLYNTLEAINWRAQLAGEQEIAEMIQALSVIMDAGINRDMEKEIPLAREVAFMDRYMYLIERRFGDKITYETDFTEEALSCLVPKMIVQPLLENAVKHGIEPVGRGKIQFCGHVSQGRLHLAIADTGKGMTHSDKSMVRRIFEQEAKSRATSDRRRSIGLRNVARRLFLIYGKTAEIAVDSHQAEGTRFTMHLPMKKEQDDGRQL